VLNLYFRSVQARQDADRLRDHIREEATASISHIDSRDARIEVCMCVELFIIMLFYLLESDKY
jgi:vacuolar-type H+-ATPase subunit H